MKKVMIVLAVIVVLVIAVIAVAWVFVDSIAKAAIEKGGTAALGVATTVQSVSVSLLGGTVDLSGLLVANPTGFETPHLMESRAINIGVRPGSLLSDTIEVNQFVIDGLDMYLEQQPGNKTNVGVVMDHLKEFGGEGGQGGAKKESSGGKKIKVDTILVQNIVVHLKLQPVLGRSQAKVRDITIPKIEMKDVTSDNAQGVVVSELMARLMPAITAAILQEGADVLPAALRDGLGKDLAETTKALGGGASDLVGQMGKGVGGLLGIGQKSGEQEPSKEGETPKDQQPKNPLEGLQEAPKKLGEDLKDIFGGGK